MTNPTGSILLRRGPTTDRLAFVPLDGEIIYDTDQKKVYVGDGSTYGGKTVTSDITISGTGQVLNIPNSALQNSTISGIALGSSLYNLNFGTHLTGTSYNGSVAVSLGVDATDANTASKIVARDGSGNFSAGTITATLNGNATSATTATTATTASSVTNGVYTTGSYSNPTWITSLSETKVLPSQTGNSGKFLSTNGTNTGWVSAAAIGFPSIVGNSGKFLSTDGTTVTWTSPNNGTLSLSTSGVGIDVASTTFTANQSGNASFVVSSSATQINIPSTIVYRDDSGNFSVNLISIAGTISDPTHAVPKSYADTLVPNQSGKNGQWLTTDGTSTSWANITPAANGQLTLAVSGTGLSGSATFTANQSTGSTFTVTSNATDANTPSTIIARDASGNFSAGVMTGNATGLAALASVASIFEKATITASAPTSTINFDIATQSVQYYTTSTTGSFIVNVRSNNTTSLNSAMSIGQSISFVIIVNCSNSTHYATGLTIDSTSSGSNGYSYVVKWQGGTQPVAGDGSSIDVYTCNIIKTADKTFTVFASITKFA
jgi:hypothetical protein